MIALSIALFRVWLWITLEQAQREEEATSMKSASTRAKRYELPVEWHSVTNMYRSNYVLPRIGQEETWFCLNTKNSSWSQYNVGCRRYQWRPWAVVHIMTSKEGKGNWLSLIRKTSLSTLPNFQLSIAILVFCATHVWFPLTSREWPRSVIRGSCDNTNNDYVIRAVYVQWTGN